MLKYIILKQITVLKLLSDLGIIYDSFEYFIILLSLKFKIKC